MNILMFAYFVPIILYPFALSNFTYLILYILTGTDSEKAKQDYINNVQGLIATIGLKE